MVLVWVYMLAVFDMLDHILGGDHNYRLSIYVHCIALHLLSHFSEITSDTSHAV